MTPRLLSINKEYIMYYTMRGEGRHYVRGTSLRQRGVVTSEGCRYVRGMSLRQRGVVTSEGRRYVRGTSLRQRGVVTSEGRRYVTQADLAIVIQMQRLHI